MAPVVSTDRYGAEHRDYGDAAARRPARGWIQQKTTTDIDKPERPSGYETGVVFYTHAKVSALDRIEHEGRVYEIDGDVYTAASPRGPHHARIRLRLVEG